LSRLAEPTNRVLATAAVVGPEFEPAVVERAAGVGQDEVLAAVEEALGARLLVEVSADRYRFAHALVRATLYDELSGPRRLSLHRRVAEAIESLHGPALDDHLPALVVRREFDLVVEGGSSSAHFGDDLGGGGVPHEGLRGEVQVVGPGRDS